MLQSIHYSLLTMFDQAMENGSQQCGFEQLQTIQYPMDFWSRSSLEESGLRWLRQLELLADGNWSKILKNEAFLSRPFPSDSVKAPQEENREEVKLADQAGWIYTGLLVWLQITALLLLLVWGTQKREITKMKLMLLAPYGTWYWSQYSKL